MNQAKKMSSRLLSLVISFSILLGTIAIPELALAGPDSPKPEYSASKADISFKFLGTYPSTMNWTDMETSPGVSATLPTDNDLSNFTWKTGDYVLVGVYLSKLSNIKSMMGTAGINTLTLNLIYNEDNFTWTPNNSVSAFGLLDGTNDYYLEEGFSATYPYKEGKRSNTPYYTTQTSVQPLSGLMSLNAEWAATYPVTATNYDTANLKVAKQAIRFDTTAATDEEANKMFSSSHITAIEAEVADEENPRTDDETLMAIYPLKMGTQPTGGHIVLEGTFGPSTFVLNTNASYNYCINPEEDAETNLVNKFNIVNNVIDIAPLTADQKGIKVTTDGTFTTTLTDMQDIKGITKVEEVYGDSDPANDVYKNASSYKLYYGPGNDSTIGVSASKSTLTDFATNYHEIKTSETDTWQNGVPVAANNSYLYVVAGDYVWNLGKLAVTATAINAIKGVTGEQPASGTTLYTGDNIVIPNTTKVTVGYDNGKDKVLLKNNTSNVDEIAAAGLKFYRVDNNSGTEALTEVKTGADSIKYTATEKEKLTIKKNTIRLSTGEAPNVKDYYEVPVTYNKVTLTANSGSELNLKFNANDTIDLSKVKVDAKKLSDAAAATLTYGADGQTFTDAGVKIVIVEPSKAASKTDLAAAPAITSSTQITQAMIDGGYHVVAVAANDKADNVSYVDLGAISVKAGDQYAVDGTLALAGTTDADKTYPNAVLDLTSATVKVTDGDTNELKQTINLTDTGVTLSIVTKGATPTADTEILASVDANTKIKPAWAGKSLKIVVGGKTLYATIPTVTKKTLTLTFSGTVADRTYSGKDVKTVPAGITAALPTTGGVESGDTAPTVPAITYTYADGNAADGKAITAAIDTGETTEFDNYIIALPANGATEITGNIKPKTLNITAIKGITTGVKDAATAADVVLTNKTADQDNFTSTDLVAGDKVTLTYTAKFAAADVTTAGTNKDVTISDTSLSGDDAANYTLGTVAAKGTVSDKTLTGIELDTTGATLTYTYPDLTPDFSGVKVTAVYDDTTKAEVTGATFSVADDATLAYGKTTVTVTYKEGDKTATATFDVTANKKPIKLSDIKFKSTMVYGDDDSKVDTFEFPTEDGKGLVAGDTSDNVKVEATYTFTDPSTTGKEKEIEISKITLGGGKADNYVIVDDEGNPITENTTTKVDTGVISQGSQEPPEKPVVKVDNATNNIVVTSPLNNEGRIEYTIGDPAAEDCVWQTSPVFTGLDKNKEYTVVARTKATEDGNYGPSVPTEGTKAKTYANRVRAFKKNADITTAKPAKEFYTDLTKADSVSDINTKIFDKKPTSFKAYFTDATCKTKVEYPMTIGADTVLYYTTGGNGGGGGGASVSLSLSAASAKGLVGDKIKIDATIKGSTSKPTWKSSDEKVATVDEQGNIVMVGEGTATVTVTVAGVTKTVKVTVGKPEATPTPTPTAKPTDAPVIPDNYLKPYVSGYDEGDFRPENAITRAELATMIAKLAYGDDLPDGVYDASFWDVESDAWYNKYIGYLENLNILNGYDEGDFRPNNLISRGEICAVIVRAQKFNMVPYAGLFTDVTEDDWAKDYIQTLASMNIATGYEDGSFGPYNSLIRAEAVTIINRLLAPSEPIVTWTPWDISGHWAESAIMLAANERKLIGAEPAPEATVEPAPEATPEATPTAAPEMDPNVKLDVNPEATTEPTATPAA